MKFCSSCGKEVSPKQAFCQNCGAATSAVVTQVTEDSTKPISENSVSSFLRLLCVLTIIGSIFGIFRGLIYEMVTAVADDGRGIIKENHAYIRGWLYVLTNMGTLIGAIFMLLKQKLGLYIYTVAQSLYILVVIVATFVYDSASYFEGAEQFSTAVALFFLIPSILFFFLYWLKVNTEELTK